MSKLENQFYKDNAPNFDEFKVLGALFDSLSDAFDDIITQSIDNSKISTMRTFTTIPMQTINIVDACYSLPTILTNKEVLNTVGIDPLNTMQERIDIWNNLDPKIRAVALDQLGLVLMLVNPNTLKGGEDTYMDTFKVIDFEMYDQSTGDKLIFGLDYYYEFNKIYFLRFGAQTNKYNNKRVILKNIVIDTNNPEKVLGESLGIYANSNFSATEYRDVITSFASAALAGPVVSRINQSFNPDANLLRQTKSYGLLDNENALKGVTVVDYKSADPVRKRFWDLEVEGSRRLNGFDFLVVTPIEYLYRTEKIEYVQEFVKMIKPAQSSFVICPEIIFKDIISMRYSKFSFNTSGKLNNLLDKLKYYESLSIPTKHTTKDDIVALDDTHGLPLHTTEDLLDMSLLSHKLTYNPVYSPIDNILYVEDGGYKIGHLKASEKVHTRRATFHVADDVLLDTDYFDCILLTDYFHALVTTDLEDKIPQLNTGDFKMTWVKFITDNIKCIEHAKKMMYISTSEKVRVSFLHGNERAYKTDNGELYDEVRLDDCSVTMKQELNIKDTFDLRECKSSVDLSHVDLPEDKINNIELNDIATQQGHSDKLASQDNPITSPLLNPVDSIKMKCCDNQFGLLNTDILYDKISNREGNEITTFQNQADKIKFSSASNIVICDSFVEYDYDEATSFRLDIVGTPADEEANVYEVVAIKLIPKEG